MSRRVAPRAKALDDAAPLTEWALNLEMSMPHSLSTCFNQVAIVGLETPWWGLKVPMKNLKGFLRPGSSRRMDVLRMYALQAATGQIDSSSGKGNNSSGSGILPLEVFEGEEKKKTTLSSQGRTYL